MAAQTRPVLRVLTLGGAGLVTFYVAAQWSGTATPSPDADDVVAAVPAKVSVTGQPSGGSLPPLPAAASGPAAAATRVVPSASGQAFGRLSWVPPPPPPAPAPPPPPPAPVVPTPPPLPFSFVGMLEHGMSKPQAFLAKGDTLLVVSVGELLENNTYRVESFDANQVVITYLPLTMKQTIDVSGSAR